MLSSHRCVCFLYIFLNKRGGGGERRNDKLNCLLHLTLNSIQLTRHFTQVCSLVAIFLFVYGKSRPWRTENYLLLKKISMVNVIFFFRQLFQYLANFNTLFLFCSSLSWHSDSCLFWKLVKNRVNIIWNTRSYQKHYLDNFI